MTPLLAWARALLEEGVQEHVLKRARMRAANSGKHGSNMVISHGI
jgi:hypothetical protein